MPSDLRVGEIPSLKALKLQQEVPEPLPGGERAGRAQMHAWLRDGIDDYAERHDRLAGGTSVL